MARRLFVPIVTATAATAAAFVAYRYAPRQATAAWRHRRRSARHRTGSCPSDDEQPKSTPRLEAEDHEASAAQVNVNVQHSEDLTRLDSDAEEAPRSTHLIAMLLQDSSLLMSMFGLGLLVIVLLVSLAVVLVSDALQSPNELQMFTPLVCTALALILVGMLHSLCTTRGSLRDPKPMPTHHHIAAKSTSKTTAKNIHADPSIGSQELGNDSQEPVQEPDVSPPKRKSRCPLGFH